MTSCTWPPASGKVQPCGSVWTEWNQPCDQIMQASSTGRACFHNQLWSCDLCITTSRPPLRLWIKWCSLNLFKVWERNVVESVWEYDYITMVHILYIYYCKLIFSVKEYNSALCSHFDDFPWIWPLSIIYLGCNLFSTDEHFFSWGLWLVFEGSN